MKTEELQRLRKQRALELVKISKISRRSKEEWRVPSQTKVGNYKIFSSWGKETCNCPDFMERGLPCKHILAVELIQQLETKELKQVKKMAMTAIKKITYSQDWHAYDNAQTKEKELFMRLLSEALEIVEEPAYAFGRPKLSLKDLVFASALKVYSTFSLRRFMTDMRGAFDKGLISKVSSYSSVSNYMRDKNLVSVLMKLIKLTSKPLTSIETKFAIDSSGFRTTLFNDYCREKHETKQEHHWVKMHICCGVKTNVVTAVSFGDENHSADSPQFIPLTKETLESGFNIKEVSGDKAYSARDNLGFVDSIGATAYVPFKINATGRPNGKSWVWRKMFNYFTYNREEFMEHYHKRSNVETTFRMIKSKFTDLIRSKDKTAQINELLLKVLCHNICVLIQEMQELNITEELF
jgi:transposase